MMKKLIIKIVLFLLPILIVAFPIDYYLSNYFKKSHINGDIEVWNDIYQGEINCDIAVYGSSRAWVHINPLIMEDTLKQSVYNFGIDGHNFWLQYLRHLEFKQYNHSPKMIILSVDEFSLQKRENLYNPDQFLPFMLWSKRIYEYTSSYKGYSVLDYYVPLIRYMGKWEIMGASIKSLFYDINNSQKIRNKGFKGQKSKWNDDFEKAKKKQSAYVAELDSASILLFNQFVRECKESCTELILVYTPEYIEGQNFISNRQEIIAIYKNTAKDYDLLFLDYSNDELCYHKRFFYNALHLNSEGADLFTKKLASDIKKQKIGLRLAFLPAYP
jgi:hypothetical protein